MSARRILIVIFIAIMLAPPEFQFHLGELVLGPQRLLLLISFPLTALAVIARSRGGATSCDLLAIAHVALAWTALSAAHGFASSLEPAGAYVVDFAGAYFFARFVIRSPTDLGFLARCLFVSVVVLAASAIPETLSGRHWVREIAAAIRPGVPIEGSEERLGLTRAMSSLPHPILLGVAAAAPLGLVWYAITPLDRRLWPRFLRASTLLAATAASLSTAPFVAFSVQIGIIAWDKLTKHISYRWTLLVSLFLFAYAFVDMTSNRDPVSVFISYLTFNPDTGFARQLIWEFGSAEVVRHPWLGIGMNDWVRPEWMSSSSVDNFWLLTSMRYGLPCTAALAALILGPAFRMRRMASTPLRPFALAWLTSMTGLVIAGLTVHFWGSAFVLFAFLCGSGVAITSVGRTTVAGIAPRGAPACVRRSSSERPVAVSFCDA